MVLLSAALPLVVPKVAVCGLPLPPGSWSIYRALWASLASLVTSLPCNSSRLELGLLTRRRIYTNVIYYINFYVFINWVSRPAWGS